MVGNRYEVEVLVEELNGESSDSIVMFIKVVDGDEPPHFILLKALMLISLPLPRTIDRST